MKIFCQDLQHQIAKDECYSLKSSPACKKCEFRHKAVSSIIESKPRLMKPKVQVLRRKPMDGTTGPTILHLGAAWSMAYLALLGKSFNKMTPGEKLLFDRLRGALKLLEISCWRHLIDHMISGETWPVGIALKALGSKALSNEWFIKGLQLLLNEGKAIQLSVSESYETKFQDLIDLGRQMEKYREQRAKIKKIPRAIRSHKRLTAENVFDMPSETLRTKYFRDFPRAFEVQILAFCGLYVVSLDSIPSSVIARLPESKE